MKILAGGCRVFDETSGTVLRSGTWTARSLICRETGSRQITQSVSEYAQGRSPMVVNPMAEEVLYVAEGQGECWLNDSAYDLRPGTGVYIPPGTRYWIQNPEDQKLRIVHSCCPEDPGRQVLEHTSSESPSPEAGPIRTVHEQDRPVIRAGKDREFRYLVNADVGCRQITQFVGWIPPSKAPFHHHEYEEGIFVLEGHGIVHVESEACEFGPRSSIYFPVGVRHCIENPGEVPIRLLGAFYPSGSPGAAYED